MWNDSSNNKKFVCFIVFILLIFCPVSINKVNVAYAENDELYSELKETTDGILDGLETDELDEYLMEESFIDYFSFKEFVSAVLSGEYLTNYDSLIGFVKDVFLDSFKENLRFFVYLFVCVVLYEIFKSFCEDKYIQVKRSVKIVFCFLFCLILLSSFKNYYGVVLSFIERVFEFTAFLFPILVALVTMTGATTSAGTYGALSVFVLSSGSYIIKYILLPVSVSIFLLSLFGSVMKNKKFDRVCDISKLIFKYVVILFFSIFGLLSFVNIMVTGSKDGINMRLTKYAIKNYVPVLGGYISDGFDFIKSCSVLIKNAFGFCSVLMLFSMLIAPLVLSLVFIFGFKILSALTGYVGDGAFSDMFNDVSKAYSNFLTVLIGLFLIMFIFIFLVVMSVWVV